MLFSKRSLEGYLMVDHRASPGLTPEQALRLGYHPTQVAEGRLFEAASLRCFHCGTHSIKNPMRVRERASCLACGANYICDNCDLERKQPGYVHASFQEKVDAAHDLAIRGVG